MKLYTYYRSSAAYRVRIALHLKGISFESIPVNLVAKAHQSDTYLASNKQGLIPLLVLDNGESISQSLAILEWLETRPERPALLPPQAEQAAKVRQIAYVISSDIHPLNNLRVLNYLTQTFNITSSEKTDWYHYWIHKGFKALEDQVSAQPYCCGTELSLADVCLIPQIYNALRFKCDLSSYPKLRSIYKLCETYPAFIAAHPDQQADSPNS